MIGRRGLAAALAVAACVTASNFGCRGLLGIEEPEDRPATGTTTTSASSAGGGAPSGPSGSGASTSSATGSGGGGPGGGGVGGGAPPTHRAPRLGEGVLSVGRAPLPGRLTLSSDGFEFSARSCTGALCVTGGVVP